MALLVDMMPISDGKVLAMGVRISRSRLYFCASSLEVAAVSMSSYLWHWRIRDREAFHNGLFAGAAGA